MDGCVGVGVASWVGGYACVRAPVCVYFLFLFVLRYTRQ